MHNAVKNLTDTGVNIKSGSNTEVYLISEILLNQVWQLKQLWLSLREIVSAVESGVVTSRILQEVQSFIKFPMAEVLTCPEEKLAKCPPEILEEIFQYLDPKDLKSIVLVNKTAVWCLKETEVLVQVHGFRHQWHQGDWLIYGKSVPDPNTGDAFWPGR